MFKTIKNDLPASLVVFFVALPLCLGIALASGAPLFAGIIAGIVGGIIVGSASGSSLGVSGPAAGLAVIVLNSIQSLGDYQLFLAAVVVAGLIQLALGFLKAGFIAYFFPSSVIKGMLSGIGILIIIKQIPHALGYDKDVEGDFSFAQITGENSFEAIASAFNSFTTAAIVISSISILMLVLWEAVLTKKHKIFRLIQGPIAVICFGVLMSYLFTNNIISLTLSPEHLVSIPVPKDLNSFIAQFTMPNFSGFRMLEIWRVGAVMAIVASLETLLCVEATDKLDPEKKETPTNRELKAQGLGNLVSGLIGGLPLTQVIVRSSANIAFGAKSKMSGILHGFWLLISAFTIAGLLNMIPLASLAAILLIVGYKLAKPSVMKDVIAQGYQEYIPFFATIVGIVLTDLLTGIGIGMAFGIFFTLKVSYENSHSIKVIKTKEDILIHKLELAEEVTFLNKTKLLNTFKDIPPGSKVVIDYSKAKSIANDINDIINNFIENSSEKNITVETIK